MDVVLGVAVTGSVARLALLGPDGEGNDVIDQSVVDLEDNPVGKLTETVVGTNRLLADESHRLVGTRLCWTDHPRAEQLRRALADSGVPNVAVLSESQAVAALMRAAGRPGAALVVGDETATLSLVGSGSGSGDVDAPPTLLASGPLAGGDATATFDTLMARLGEYPGAPGEVYLVGASDRAASDLTRIADRLGDATTRVQTPDDPTFALARGAALAAAPPDATRAAPVRTGDETAMLPGGDATALAPAPEPDAEEQQLAYSMAGDSELLPAFDEYGAEYGDIEAGRAPLNRRALLIGNAVIAFAVIGFASLAVAVAIAVRPTASQEPVVGHQNAAPGKFMPLLPTQQQAPVPPPPPDRPTAGFQGGTIPAPANGGAVPQPASPPAVGGPVPNAPVAPGAPGGPGFVPNPLPNVPMPVPIPIPFPGWQPAYPNPPYNPPTTNPPTTSNPPTTTYSPPSTTVAPVTPTEQSTVPSTQPTTEAPVPAYTQPQTQAPQTEAPQTQAPVPAYTQPQTQAPQTQAPQTRAPQPVAPEPHIPQGPGGAGGGQHGFGF